MVYPTFTVLTFAAILAAVLLAGDWYVWGLTYAADFRSPHPVKPRGDLVERFMVRWFATNEARVPRTEANPATVTPASVSAEAEDDGHGFKKVA